VGKTVNSEGASYIAPKMWKGETAIVIGGGPSLIGMDLCLPYPGLERYFDRNRVIGVNSACYFGPSIDVCFFGDAKWYWHNRDYLQKEFSGLMVTVNARVPGREPGVENEPNVNVIRRGGSRGVLFDGDAICWNKSSGGAAINLAVLFGAKRIVLLGYDMKRGGGMKNFIPHHWESTNSNPYEGMMMTMEHLKTFTDKRGIEILNATPGSALNVFPKVNLHECC